MMATLSSLIDTRLALFYCGVTTSERLSPRYKRWFTFVCSFLGCGRESFSNAIQGVVDRGQIRRGFVVRE